MVHLWGPGKRRAWREGTGAVPGVGTGGDITVIVEENGLTQELVRLACLMAKRARCGVRLLHVIEVPRTLPLSATLTATSELADRIMAQAQAEASETGCAAHAAVVQARDAATAIVEEVREQPCALLLIGLVPGHHSGPDPLGKLVPYILAHAPCRVWLLQEAPTRQLR
jgi:nucleotide-binding universal stress UspA family protein